MTNVILFPDRMHLPVLRSLYYTTFIKPLLFISIYRRHNMDAIQISHLKKYYSDIKAVDDISFSVKKGNLFRNLFMIIEYIYYICYVNFE